MVETKTVAGLVNRTLATLASLPPARPTVTRRALNSKDKEWNAKWLKLETLGQPALEHLQAEAFHFCADYAKDQVKGRLLIIYGNNGVGKTLVAEGIARWAFESRNNYRKLKENETHVKVPDVKFARWPRFLDTLKNGDWEKVTEAMHVNLLVLDEIGGAHDPSGMGTDKLCSILSHRETKWTVITTNLTPENWENAFDRRIASRFFRNATHVEMNSVSDYNVQ